MVAWVVPVVVVVAIPSVRASAGAAVDPFPPAGSSTGYQDTSLSVPTNGQLAAQWTNPSAITCEHTGLEHVSAEAYVGGTLVDGTLPWNASASVEYSCANGTLDAPVAQIQLDGTVEQMSASLGDHMAVTIKVPDGGSGALFVGLDDTTSGQSEAMANSHGFTDTVNDLFVGMDPTGRPKKIPRFGSIQFTGCVFHGQPLLDIANMTQVSMLDTDGQSMIGIAPGTSGRGFKATFRLEGPLAAGD
jgi:hypothetical protein